MISQLGGPPFEKSIQKSVQKKQNFDKQQIDRNIIQDKPEVQRFIKKSPEKRLITISSIEKEISAKKAEKNL